VTIRGASTATLIVFLSLDPRWLVDVAGAMLALVLA
jgi:hypothetical protein